MRPWTCYGKHSARHPSRRLCTCFSGALSFLLRPVKATLHEWEVWSMKGQDEVNSGAKWQATKMGEVETEDQARAKRRC